MPLRKRGLSRRFSRSHAYGKFHAQCLCKTDDDGTIREFVKAKPLSRCLLLRGITLYVLQIRSVHCAVASSFVTR